MSITADDLNGFLIGIRRNPGKTSAHAPRLGGDHFEDSVAVPALEEPGLARADVAVSVVDHGVGRTPVLGRDLLTGYDEPDDRNAQASASIVISGGCLRV